MPTVVVVGDVMADVLVAVTAPFSHASDTASSISTAPGGAAANQAVWLSRAGAVVAMVASVGRDPFADAALRALEVEGVDTSAVLRADTATGVVVALVEPDGQRSMLTDRGANLSLSTRAVEAATGALATGAHLHLSGYCLLDEQSRPAGLRAIELAREAGTSFSVDACSAGPLRSLGADRFLEWTIGARLLFCNAEEGAVLAGVGDPASTARALCAGAAEVVLTMGADGVVVAGADGSTTHGGAPEAPALDTTGAGDAFSGTYLAARLAGASVDDALRAGTAASARCIAAVGARRWAER